MCRDYERERRQREYEALIDDEYQQRKRPTLRLAVKGRERNDFTGPTTALTRPAPIYRTGSDGLELVMANWWFVPNSFKGTYRDWQKKLTTFNARSEGIATSRTFRQAFAAQRCLVPASGWFEWIEPPGWKKGQKKTKMVFTVGDHEPIFLAGIWDRFENTDPENPGPMDTFALVTHEPSADVAKFHDRTPFVLPRETWADWLDASYDAQLDLIPPVGDADKYRVSYVSGPNSIG